jgi:hypothetical protein
VTNGTTGATRLIWPSLGNFYSSFFEIVYALMRVVIGYILFMHGWAKLSAGVGAVAGSMAKKGSYRRAALLMRPCFLRPPVQSAWPSVC